MEGQEYQKHYFKITDNHKCVLQNGNNIPLSNMLCYLTSGEYNLPLFVRYPLQGKYNVNTTFITHTCTNVTYLDRFLTHFSLFLQPSLFSTFILQFNYLLFEFVPICGIVLELSRFDEYIQLGEFLWA